MRPSIEFDPPTLIFSSPFTGEKAFRKAKLRNTLAKAGIIFQARMESVETEFSVSESLTQGYGTILPGGYTELKVSRTVENSPEARTSACDRLNIYFHYLIEGEIAFLSDPSYQTLKKLWDTAAQRGKSTGSGIGVATIPIELFNTSVTQRPFETWKDPKEWSPFVYRPGVEDKAALFKPESSAASTGGAFGLLWKCKMKINGDDKVHEVALKEIRLSQAVLQVPIDRSRVLTRAEKELDVWKQLDHPNIGLIIGWLLQPSVCLMSPWYPNGNVLAFVQAQKHRILRDQQELRWKLVEEVADGMQYLHSKNVVHGDFCHDQVLVDDNGHAKIVDFGLAKVIEEGVDTKITTSIRHKGRYEYMAPELLLSTPPRLKESDVFAFGLLMLEVAAARTAFAGLTPGPVAVTQKTVEKTHLPKPASFSQELLKEGPFWSIFDLCTTYLPKHRPGMSTIATRIHEVASSLETVYPSSH